MRFMTRPLRYLDELVDASEKLANPGEEPIRLSRAMKSVEDELNLVREGALRNAMLAKEAEQAQRLRRQQAQILGEQASTRLLFPMILMLLVVFVILLVPAWLTFAV